MEGAEHAAYHQVCLGSELDTATMRRWMYLADAVCVNVGCNVAVCGDYDSKIVLHFWISRPFTEEEKQEARNWLENNPPHLDERDPVRWRKPVPFSNIHDGRVDKAP